MSITQGSLRKQGYRDTESSYAGRNSEWCIGASQKTIWNDDLFEKTFVFEKRARYIIDVVFWEWPDGNLSAWASATMRVPKDDAFRMEVGIYTDTRIKRLERFFADTFVKMGCIEL